MAGDGAERVLIAGGGVAALEAALALRALVGEQASIELLAPEPYFWYRSVAVAEPFGLGEARHFELAEIASAAGATFTLGALAAVDDRRRLARTAGGAEIAFDSLLVACGATPTVAVPGALTFRGPVDVEALERILLEAESGQVRRLVFAMPSGAAWPLPVYELGLLTAARLHARGVHGVEVAIVTPEQQPLQLFGSAATALVLQLLEERGVELHTGAHAAEALDGELRLVRGGSLAADRVVALPRLRGQRIDGVPQTLDGFVPVDAHGRVAGTANLFAAGDITSFPIKQGGLAAQQAQAAAEAIAARIVSGIEPQPFRPVLRGLLLTGAAPRFLRSDLERSPQDAWASESPLWWPPTKVVGRWLAPFLAGLAGIETPAEPAAEDGQRIEVELEPWHLELVSRRLPPAEIASRDTAVDGEPRTVGDVMSREPLVVTAERTLAEVARALRERDTGSALVVEEGRLVGILTSRDLLRALAGPVDSGGALVRGWMTAEPVAVGADEPLDAAELLMTEAGVHHLPVVEEGRPVGMVGLREVTRVTAATRPHALGLGF